MYRFYATMLDAFTRFQRNEDAEAAKIELLNRINRVATPQTDPMMRGIELENAVNTYHGPSDALVQVHDKAAPSSLILELQSMIAGSISQAYVEAWIETRYGPVILYGKADYIMRNICADLKYTENYDFPKYLHSWQRIVYPYCLNQMGHSVTLFRYIVVPGFNSRPVTEDYIYRPQSDTDQLRVHVEDLIETIEAFRNEITDTRIFGEAA